jgi:hypothetical protein
MDTTHDSVSDRFLETITALSDQTRAGVARITNQTPREKRAGMCTRAGRQKAGIRVSTFKLGITLSVESDGPLSGAV